MPNRVPLSSSAGLKDRVDAVVDGALAAERIVGAVVIVSIDGEIFYRRAAGLADREAETPMREDTLFRLASVSKLFVAAAAMALIAQGALDLDQAVTDWLPGFTPKFENREPRITLRHFLSHSAGLGYGFLERENGPLRRAGVSDGMDRSGLTLAENLRRLSGVPLLFEGAPGWGYGLGFSVLRDARAAGTPETPGTWRWGGAYSHSWFVDPERRLSVVAMTNTALEGMSNGGRFPTDLTRAIYAGL